ncbi:hypothetical protein BYT27DRAFT_7252295 [Phlegmacium glaucopus]|nr:hypothetical protein BYT27DRAFT_7252295 [Phlegmacium glaucopus]
MENCANHVPQVARSLFLFRFPLTFVLTQVGHVILSDNCPRNIDCQKSDNILHSQFHPDFHGMWAPVPSPIKHIESLSPPPLGSLTDRAPRTLGIHISFSVNDFVLFLWAAFAAGSYLVFSFVNLPRLCDAGER